ncbi:hypothetical protein [Enterobacter sichuanensis]|uniref:hypothetical protein n=1 Tax=Enterobacter sichuanensis TaxID=2071710 RepID=UPI002A83B66D|nr:hypothetical protein [Enterobacter sichuanensis]
MTGSQDIEPHEFWSSIHALAKAEMLKQKVASQSGEDANKLHTDAILSLSLLIKAEAERLFAAEMGSERTKPSPLLYPGKGLSTP